MFHYLPELVERDIMMRAGWSPPPRQEYDFNGGELGGDGGGEGGGSVRWGEEHQGDSWEKRRGEGGNVGEVRGQLVLAPGGGGENSTTLRVRIREESGGEEVVGGGTQTLSRWKSPQNLV